MINRPSGRRGRAIGATALLTALTVSLTACSSSSSSSSSSTSASAAGSTASAAAGGPSLAGVCPSTIDIQTGWDPAVGNDYELYELAAPGGEVDSNNKVYTSELIAHGADTGVKIKLRVGGAVKAYQSGGNLMAQDSSIMLTDDSLDTNISQSAKNELVELFAPQLHNALGVMWDQSKSWKTISDLGKANVPIIVSNSGLYPWEYLAGKGVIKTSELNKSYKGAPALFVAAGGSSAQQGYADAEPWLYENAITQWGKPVAFQKVSDYGYDPYANAIATTAENVTKYSACLTKLIPIMQQAAIDYIASPAQTNALIVDLAKKYNDGWTYTAGQATWAASALISTQVVANSADGTFGSIDPTRVSDFLTLFTPLLAQQNISPKAGLKPTDLYNNQFIDKSIKLPPSVTVAAAASVTATAGK
ncbi:MAG: ABC transporter substrate-binding protein [Actinobacteria bacterium]|nr:ABC transporter substrate-binding protein [Actinomycetota bacterium]